MPTRGFCSSRNTSCHFCETARAIEHPITPPPIISMFAWSIATRIIQFDRSENRQNTNSHRDRKPQAPLCSALVSVRNSWLGGSELFVPANVVEERGAIHQLRLGPVVHRIRRMLGAIVRILPQRRRPVHAVLVDRVEENVKRAQLFLVVLVVVRDPRQRLKASILRRFPLAHLLDDRVPAADLDVLFAFSG